MLNYEGPYGDGDGGSYSFDGADDEDHDDSNDVEHDAKNDLTRVTV